MPVFALKLARFMALLGGAVLLALIVITCVSVLGRGLNTLGHSDVLTGLSAALGKALLATGVAPVKGDFELVEAGIAFAIFAFLPICQLKGGHATVDIVSDQFPGAVNRFLITLWEVVFTLVVLLIAWRLFEGFQSKLRNGETTFLLQFPIWWAYGASFLAAVIAGLIAVYVAVVRVYALVTGRNPLAVPEA
ncbi:TRAP transporter small permease [Nisaea acidiphila]|uniref:TRAP transporter small permease protein n=1 Tax=Nisaea acidiphila TaxID=1862145 RepID=A0A9J7APW9_9PROT|nr:TRAP transporter small permease [Nisaea acidiphila]UUX48954.1 TRAP transporter small permease [Nisaea acidiphila]